jgi:hypothetical protein
MMQGSTCVLVIFHISTEGKRSHGGGAVGRDIEVIFVAQALRVDAAHYFALKELSQLIAPKPSTQDTEARGS